MKDPSEDAYFRETRGRKLESTFQLYVDVLRDRGAFETRHMDMTDEKEYPAAQVQTNNPNPEGLEVSSSLG
jgi:hypothetical protein